VRCHLNGSLQNTASTPPAFTIAADCERHFDVCQRREGKAARERFMEPHSAGYRQPMVPNN